MHREGFGMVLAVDVGNTNIVLGGYEDDRLLFSVRLATETKLEADQYALQLRGMLELYGARAADVTDVMLSSVVPPLTDTLTHALRIVCGVDAVVLTQALPTGIRVDIERPEELGADLVAGAAGAKALYRLPAVVIDMGTATKLTAVLADGTVPGVSILPGVFLSLNALTNGASQLSGIALQPPTRAIGRNTAQSMQSGVVLGTASMLDGMLDRFEAEMGRIETVVATGGAASFIVPYCRREIVLAPDLLLDGLYAVYKNIKKQQ